MSTLRIMLAGRDYEIACEDGQESHLKSLARNLDARMRGIAESIGKGSESQLFMLAALMLTDELHDRSQELEQARYDIHHSSQSFEKNKQIELENAVASTIHHIADRIEAIAGELEKV